MYCRISCETWLIIFGSLLAILLRVCTSLHPHSGEGTPPMYGDYEAQRHWMEVTVNLPMNLWYHNSTENDLNYWGLDYPPLTAYHMFICGKIAGFLNDNYTKLHDSRGHESEAHKLFMRLTVLICDVAVFLPALIVYYSNIEDNWNDTGVKRRKQKLSRSLKQIRPMSASLSTILAFLYPGIILIDHGHFQYNCVSLGFFISATTCLLHKHNIIASIFFCLALNYKQMELYHALPFFLYLLSTCVPKPGQNAIWGFLKLFSISFTVIITFGLIWFPFLTSFDDLLQVLHRQFPLARGVFEDKVSNIWCALNVVFKFKTRFDNLGMMRVCLFSTILALFPSSADLFLRPNLKKFVLALINSSLAFFLFSFQVHEKSILLVAIPVLMYFPHSPFTSFWFLCISVFSMTPLLLKDNLNIALVALTIMYVVSFRVTIEHAHRSSLNTQDSLLDYYQSLIHTLLNVEYKKCARQDIVRITIQQIGQNSEAIKIFLFHSIMFMSLSGCVCLYLASLFLSPPGRYPDLYPLLTSIYSCIHFVGFFVYFNIKQLRIPQQFEEIRHVKFKLS